MKILVLNCGSSSLKYQLLDMTTELELANGRIERIGMDDAILVYEAKGQEIKEISSILDHTTAVKRVLSALMNPETGVVASPSEIGAVGHRVVHGGETFSASVLITPEVKDAIRACFDLAPLHNPPNLIGIQAAEEAMPGTPMVAVFDTAFHATMPRHAFLYALPYVLYKRHQIRRYGFHGTSHRFVSDRVASLMGRPLAELKVITCHLGNGASVAAIEHGEVVDTSMGFTPLEGLVMGTRSGDLDASVVPFVMAKEELGLNEVNSMLNKHSGLVGICGLSDMREIEAEMEAGNRQAKDAFEMFVYRLRKYIGSYAAAMDGVDAIVFTGGIGENSRTVRAAVLEKLGYLGISADLEANKLRGEHRISTAESKVAVWIVPTNEELVIARDTLEIVNQ